MVCDTEDPSGNTSPLLDGDAANDTGDTTPSQVADGNAEELNNFSVPVDGDNRATEFKFLSAKRPHMRTFYVATTTMFVGMWIWTSVAPLQTTILDTSAITESDLATASTMSVLGSMFMRVVGGSFTDRYGASRVMAAALLMASAATCLTTLVETGAAIIVCRFFSGFAGGTLIIAQAWIAKMFSKNVIGTSMGLVLGFGYSGNGFAQAFLGSALLPAFTESMGEKKAWQIALLLTGAAGLLSSIAAACLGNDTPEERFKSTNKNGGVSGQSKLCGGNFLRAARNPATWILSFQYAMSSGTNAALLNIGVFLFVNIKGTSAATASAITSVVGWLGLSCFVGGLISDRATQKTVDLKGRYMTQFGLLAVEGALFVALPFVVDSFAGSATMFLLASMMATWAAGSTFALVPYVDREATGSVAGIVGFLGGLGGILLILLVDHLGSHTGFIIAGSLVMLSGCASFLLRIDHNST